MEATLRGDAPLSTAYRNGMVETIQKSAVLTAAWENDEPKLSPVYSMAVHSEAVFLLTGTDAGSINVWSGRHQEGKFITSLNAHSRPVSALELFASDSKAITGSWDKSIKILGNQDFNEKVF